MNLNQFDIGFHLGECKSCVPWWVLVHFALCYEGVDRLEMEVSVDRMSI
jgi:hypothetical protein